MCSPSRPTRDCCISTCAIGETYLRQCRIAEAERAFEKTLDIDGDSAEAHLGLAVVGLRQRRYEDAAAQALLAVGCTGRGLQRTEG